MSLVTNYYTELFEPKNFSTKVNKVAALIRKSDIRYTAIAFCGMSGTMVAPIVAARLDKQMLMIRKNVNDCHSPHMVEGRRDVKSYIIVDDRIASGNTVIEMMRQMREFTGGKAKLKGIFLYNCPYSDSEEELQKLIGVKVPIRKIN